MRASSAARIALCPGSYRAEDGLPETTSPEAERGTRIHKWLADPESIVLPDEEQEVANDLRQKTDRIEQGFPNPSTEVYLEWEDWSGHVDWLAVAPASVCIVDWKTGWGDLPAPDSNAQLRVYAVLAHHAHPDKTVVCYIVKPGRCPSPVAYGEEDIAVAMTELRAIAAAAKAPNAPRIPGPTQCQYCKALGHPDRCPESCKLPAQTAELMPAVESKLAMMAQCDLDTLAVQIQLVAKMGAKVIEELKVRLENNPECSEVFKLGKPTMRRELMDVAEAFYRLPDKVFFAGASLSLGDAAKKLAEVTGCKVKEAPGKLAELLAGLIVEKPIARKLERK